MNKPAGSSPSRQHCLIVSADRDFTDWVISVLHPRFQVVHAAPNDDHLKALVQSMKPDLAIVDIDDTDWQVSGRLTSVEAVRALSASLPIVVATFDVSTATAIPAMRAGANDLLDKNAGTDELLALADHHASREHTPKGSHSGHVITFMSPRAGVGVTTLAIGAAQQIITGQNGADRLLYLDFGFPPSEAADLLKLEPTYSVLDALGDLGRMDETLIESAIANYENRLFLLPVSIEQPDIGLSILSDVPSLISVLRTYFPLILVDANRPLQPAAFDRLFWDSDVSILCTDQSITSIHACSDFLEAHREMLNTCADLKIVVTRYDQRISPDAKRIAEALAIGRRPHVSPCDRVHIDNVRNAGTLLESFGARSAFSRSIRQLIAQFDERIVAAALKANRNGGRTWRNLLRLRQSA